MTLMAPTHTSSIFSPFLKAKLFLNVIHGCQYSRWATRGKNWQADVITKTQSSANEFNIKKKEYCTQIYPERRAREGIWCFWLKAGRTEKLLLVPTPRRQSVGAWIIKTKWHPLCQRLTLKLMSCNAAENGFRLNYDERLTVCGLCGLRGLR